METTLHLALAPADVERIKAKIEEMGMIGADQLAQMTGLEAGPSETALLTEAIRELTAELRRNSARPQAA